MVHKKKHDMVLNLGLGARGNTFSDQTPTPTRFIRTCEEVGLFQDLQNVNPFEEPFRRAAEAVKTGQTPVLDKSLQINPVDDTLHTPNVFPHITDLHPRNSSNQGLGVQGNRQDEDNLSKKCDIKNIDQKELPLKTDLEPHKLILGSIDHKKRKISASDETEIEGIQNDDHNEIECIKKDELYLKNIPSNSSKNVLNQMEMAIKEKIKNNIYNKQIPVVLQVKVPIPKSNSVNKCQKSQKDRFSTFSKNSLKFEHKLQKHQSGIFDLSRKRKVRKNYSGLPKERIEMLERNRAAATRCREKKKIYVSYLEKINRELTDTNKKLEQHNAYLRKQISFLQSELLKYQSCSALNLKEENVEMFLKNANINSEKMQQFKTKGRILENMQGGISSEENSEIIDKIKPIATDLNSVEVSLTEKCHFDERQKIPHSAYNESLSNSYKKPSLNKIFYEEDKLRKIYTDHSYFNYSNMTDIRKRLINSNCSAAKTKSTSALLTMDTRNQNSENLYSNKGFDIILTPDDAALEVQTEDVII